MEKPKSQKKRKLKRGKKSTSPKLRAKIERFQEKKGAGVRLADSEIKNPPIESEIPSESIPPQQDASSLQNDLQENIELDDNTAAFELEDKLDALSEQQSDDLDFLIPDTFEDEISIESDLSQTKQSENSSPTEEALMDEESLVADDETLIDDENVTPPLTHDITDEETLDEMDELLAVDLDFELENEAALIEEQMQDLPEPESSIDESLQIESISKMVAVLKPFFSSIKQFHEYIHQEHDLNEDQMLAFNLLQHSLNLTFQETGIDAILSYLNADEKGEMPLIAEDLIHFISIVIVFKDFDKQMLHRYLYIKSILKDMPPMLVSDLIKDIYSEWLNCGTSIVADPIVFDKIKYNLNDAYQNVKLFEDIRDNIILLINDRDLDEIIQLLNQIKEDDGIQNITNCFQESLSHIEKQLDMIIKSQDSDEGHSPQLEYQINNVKNNLNKWQSLTSDFKPKTLKGKLDELTELFINYRNNTQEFAKHQLATSHLFNPSKLQGVRKIKSEVLMLFKHLMENFGDMLEILEAILSSQDNLSKLNLKNNASPKFIEVLYGTHSRINALIVNTRAQQGFSYHFRQGLLFCEHVTSQESNFYEHLSMGMLTDFTTYELLNLALEALSSCHDPSEMENGFIFVNNILLNDTSYTCFQYDGEDNEITHQLKLLLEEHKSSVPAICTELAQTIESQKSNKKAKHEAQLESLTGHSDTPMTMETLSREIYLKVSQIEDSDRYDPEAIFLEVCDWINTMDPGYLNSEQMDLSNPYQAALMFIQTAHEKDLDVTELLETVRTKRSEYSEYIPPHDIIDLLPITDFGEFLDKIEDIAKGKSNKEQFVSFAKEFVSVIQSFYEKEIISLTAKELILAGMHCDATNINNGLYTTPQSLHFNRMEHFTHKCFALLSAIILFEFKGKTLKPRKNLKECKRLADFFLQMLNYAYKEKKFNTFSDIYYGLGYYIVPRFLTKAKVIKKYDFLFANQRERLDQLIKNNQQIPLVDIFIQHYNTIHEETRYDPLEKYLSIGELTLRYREAKNLIAQSNKPELDFNVEAFADAFLYSAFEKGCIVSPMTLSINIDEQLIHDLMLNMANEIMPTTKPEPASLSEFNNLKALNDYLTKSYYREWGYHLEDKPEKDEILLFVTNQIMLSVPNTGMIADINEVFESIQLIQKIEASNKQPEIDEYEVSKTIFDTYISALSHLPKDFMLKNLQTFQTQLDKSEPFQTIIEDIPKWFDFFSPKKPCYKSAIQLEDTLHDLIDQAPEADEPMETSAFIELLNIVLEGKAPSIFAGAQLQESSNFSAMMSQREYWVTEWDPENVGPSQIFLSLSEEKQSALGRFSARALQNQFLQSFTWALSLNQISKISTLVPSDALNLINTSIRLSNEIQLSVINLLLLSFDILSKLAGRDGALVLRNYDAIDALISNIEKLQEYLSSDYCQSIEFVTQLESEIQSLKIQNQQIHLMSQQNQGFFDNNENINDFCHLNEQVAHQLLNIPMTGSVLSPSQPTEKTLAEIQSAKNLIQHSNEFEQRISE